MSCWRGERHFSEELTVGERVRFDLVTLPGERRPVAKSAVVIKDVPGLPSEDE